LIHAPKSRATAASSSDSERFASRAAMANASLYRAISTPFCAALQNRNSYLASCSAAMYLGLATENRPLRRLQFVGLESVMPLAVALLQFGDISLNVAMLNAGALEILFIE